MSLVFWLLIPPGGLQVAQACNNILHQCPCIGLLLIGPKYACFACSTLGEMLHAAGNDKSSSVPGCIQLLYSYFSQSGFLENLNTKQVLFPSNLQLCIVLAVMCTRVQSAMRSFVSAWPIPQQNLNMICLYTFFRIRGGTSRWRQYLLFGRF